MVVAPQWRRVSQGVVYGDGTSVGPATIGAQFIMLRCGFLNNLCVLALILFDVTYASKDTSNWDGATVRTPALGDMANSGGLAAESCLC